MVDARLGHASIGKSSSSAETFVFASITATQQTAAEAPPVDLAIVIDRSGSMAGMRMVNALAAAAGTVERMRDVDRLTVVSFDTGATVIVPPVQTTAAAKADAIRAIRNVTANGDTCISCGMEAALARLQEGQRDRDRVRHMLLISDGDATHGIKDAPGFKQLATRMRNDGVSVSTVGVDQAFDEKIMAQIAMESNGGHYFVADPAGLSNVFAREADALEKTVAAEADVVIEPAQGVEIVDVVDRTFRREGNTFVVPLGPLAAKDEKTVLAKVRVSADREGAADVLKMRVVYRDLARKRDGACMGDLGLVVKTDGTEQKDLDPFVAARVARNRLADTLLDVNKLVEKGQLAEARATIARQQQELAKARTLAIAAAPLAPKKTMGRDLEGDFADQTAALSGASSAVDKPMSKNRSRGLVLEQNERQFNDRR